MPAGLESAVLQLENLAKKGERPSHYVARNLLLELGRALAQAPCREAIERARVAGEAVPAAWTQAIETELSLACGEFAQNVDPRYLGLPNFDVEYARAARSRLADRLRAASALGFTLAPRESEVLRLADQVFEAFQRQREEARGSSGGRAAESGEGPATPKTPAR